MNLFIVPIASDPAVSIIDQQHKGTKWRPPLSSLSRRDAGAKNKQKRGLNPILCGFIFL